MAFTKVFYDTAILFGGHALIMGHKPEVITMAQVNTKLEAEPQEIEQFGLFDRATPNYTTYYPGVKAEDLKPSDGEFIEPVFRMLSNITVNAQYNPVYFPADVLKKSMYKMIGQTINIDHEMAVGNAIGSVKSVEWQNAYTANGKKIPAGFNAVLKIDGKSNPRIARGIMMDPPSIHANSVTVNFAWQKSHPKMTDADFFQKMGSFDEKGNLIQRVASDILAYHETSLVSHGADPFAQLVKNGKIVKPEYARDRYPLGDQKLDGSENFFAFDWKQFKDDYHGEIKNPTIINNNENPEEMKDLFKFLETIMGLAADTLTEENYQEKVTAYNAEMVTLKANAAKPPEPVVVLDLTGLPAIEAEVTRLRTLAKDTPTDLTNKLALAAMAVEMTSTLKADTERLYKLSIEAGKEDAAILGVIAAADYKTLTALHKQYDELTEGKFGFTCNDCKSHNVTRASAKPEEGAGGSKTTMDTADLIDSFTSVNKVDTRFIEGPKKAQ